MRKLLAWAGLVDLVGLLLWAAGTAAAADRWFVQSERASLLAEPRFGAEVIAELGRGAALGLEEQAGHWVRISGGGGSGWLPRLVVADHPPLEPVIYLDKAGDALPQQARRRASAAAPAAATRGLQQDARQRGAGVAPAGDYGAVERVDAQQPAAAEVEAFTRQTRAAVERGDAQ